MASSLSSSSQDVYLTEINVYDVEKRYKPSKHYVYCIWVFWSDQRKQLIFRRYSQFFDLQCKLLDRFKVEAGLYNPSHRVLPFLPGKIIFGRSHIKSVALDRLHFINLYCKKLITLKKEISRCDLVLKFFELNNDDIHQASTNKLKIKEEVPTKTNPATISKPFKPEEYVCVHNYKPLSKTEINLKKGTKVFVIEKNLNGWWFVDLPSEGQGYVPKCVLKALKESSSSPHTHSEDDAPIPMQAEKFIATKDYSARKSDELGFLKGDYLEVVEKNLNGWWRAKHSNSGKSGKVPAVYLKKLVAPSNPVQSAMNAWDLFGSSDDYVPPRSDFIGGDAGTSGDAKSFDESFSTWGGGQLSKVSSESNLSSLGMPLPSSTQIDPEDVYYVIEDYQDDTGDVIGCLRQGQRVVVLDKENASGWWFVKLDDSTQGWAPSAFLSKDKPKPSKPPRPPKPLVSSSSVPDLIESTSSSMSPNPNVQRQADRNAKVLNKRADNTNDNRNFSSPTTTSTNEDKTDSDNNVEYKPVKVSEMRRRFENFK